jgi:MFS family permease
MGTHSAFFVPAKYGAMPEILTPRMLSKGNGVLESLSFLAVILGTVCGGVMSSGDVFGGSEWLIGVILTGLAVVGAVASLFIRKMPAANPGRSFPPYVYKPLIENVRALLTSRPLVFAIVGIAFFTFLVSYMRAVVYMHGQSQLPPWDEAKTSVIVGMVALGIGIGSPLVGYLSGGKVEVGLVPIGALGMMTATTLAALFLTDVPVLIVCIVFMGFFTGFYLVPLFSLLQHRAPKASKGDSIATSNFINITGAIASSLLFWLVGWSAIKTGFTPPLPQVGEAIEGKLESNPVYKKGDPYQVRVNGRTFQADEEGPEYVLLRVDQGLKEGNEVAIRAYRAEKETARGHETVTYFRVQRADAVPRPVYDKHMLPSLLFLSAGVMTLVTLGLLWYFLPDLFRRTLLWGRGLKYHVELAGMLRLPGNGPAILATDAATQEALSHVERAADRRFHLVNSPDEVRQVLARGHVAALAVAADADAKLNEILTANASAPVLPVHHADVARDGKRYVYVVAGHLLPAGSSIMAVRDELQRVAEDLSRRVSSGEALEKEALEH